MKIPCLPLTHAKIRAERRVVCICGATNGCDWMSGGWDDERHGPRWETMAEVVKRLECEVAEPTDDDSDEPLSLP